MDGLRAIAMLLVLGHHSNRALHGWIATLQQNGRGVALFFILSGFLITTLLLREKQRRGRIGLKAFFVRRAVRLLPLYYVALGVHMVLVLALHRFSPENEVLFRDKLPAYLFGYSNWLPTATEGPFFFAWSLAASEQFFLLLAPLLCFARTMWVVLVGTAAVALKFSLFQLYGAIDLVGPASRFLLSYQEPLWWGVLLGFALHHRSTYEAIARLLRPGWVAGGFGLAALAWLMTHHLQSHSAWDAQLLYLLMTMTVAGVVIRSQVPILDSQAMRHLGRISYPAYLFHMPILSAVRFLPDGQMPLVCFLFTACIVTVVATAAHQWFEMPIARWHQKLTSRTPALAPAYQGQTAA